MKRDFTPPLAAEKAEVRQAMRLHLRSLDAAFRAEASLVICELAAQLPAFRGASSVALFAPLGSEPDIHPLIEEAWAQGKQVVVPRLLGERAAALLEWHAVTQWSDLAEVEPYGLREPNPLSCPRIAPDQLDCIFVPGLAFDEKGMRLGRGSGFYDRFLGEVSTDTPRFGLMFAGQRVPCLPREPHDQALPAVITEDGVAWFKPA
jgi:5-formyltetrahydrofolate cyclo-ligase